MGKKVLAWKQLPSRPPTVATIAWLLVLDRFHAPGWVWGVIGALLVIVWVSLIHDMATQKEVEIEELKR